MPWMYILASRNFALGRSFWSTVTAKPCGEQAWRAGAVAHPALFDNVSLERRAFRVGLVADNTLVALSLILFWDVVRDLLSLCGLRLVLVSRCDVLVARVVGVVLLLFDVLGH
eukprot:5947399-Pleurochrysis_carterae.AAC.1